MAVSAALTRTSDATRPARREPVGLLGTQLGRVIERTRAAEALGNSEAKFRSVAESANEAIISADIRGDITFWNRGARSIFGYPEEEILGKPLTVLMPDRYRAAHQSGLERLHATGQSQLVGKAIELHGLRKDGKEFPLELSLATWKTEEGTFFTGILRDVTERKRGEEALRQSEERFRLHVEGVKDYAIYMLDTEGHVVSWNTGAERIKGYRADEIVGRHFSCFYPSEDVQSGKPQIELGVATAEGRFEDEGWRVRKDGSRFWANVVITALRDYTGQLRGFGKVTRDITERKHAEEQVLRLNEELKQWVVEVENANKELEAFSYSVSHDLRAPLRAMDGFSRILLEECAPALSEQGRRYLHSVRDSAQQMGRLIDDLLNFSRLSRQPLKKQRVAPAEVVRQVLQELRPEQEGRRVQIKMGDLPACEADAALLKQVFGNLLGNALKYTRRREEALIEIGCRASGAQPGEHVYFVKDNGVGFDMRYVHKLFGVFQRLHRAEDYEGTGVGLATVQRILRRHGGRIWGEAEVNKGATFQFTLGNGVSHD
jgi:PAS domain S-box-containing protein